MKCQLIAPAGKQGRMPVQNMPPHYEIFCGLCGSQKTPRCGSDTSRMRGDEALSGGGRILASSSPRLLKARGKVSKRLWWNQTERNRSHTVAAELFMCCFGAIDGDQLNQQRSRSCLDLPRSI